MKCDNCKYLTGYVLSNDECGAGNYFQYCSKGHWEGGYPPEPEQIQDPWSDCVDFKTTSE